MTRLPIRKIVATLLATSLLNLPNARAADLKTLLLLTGPISEAVQETVLLVRRGDDFISTNSLVIGCVAGASAGMMVSMAPVLGVTISTVATATPVGEMVYIVGSSIMGCGMAIAGGLAGMATARGLSSVHNPTQQ